MREKNIINPGDRFGKLTAIKRQENKTKRQGTMYECVCDCGTRLSVTMQNLKAGKTKSCGCLRDIPPGSVFGKLRVIKKAQKEPGDKGARYERQCDCGNTCVKKGAFLKYGTTTSCGCLRKKVPITRSVISSGEVFGKWTVINRVEDARKDYRYQCVCECGTTRVVGGASLRSGDSRSCGCSRAPIPGTRFGRLVVVKKSENKNSCGEVAYECICDCGNSKTVIAKSLVRGGTKSCGCAWDIPSGTRFGSITVIKKIQKMQCHRSSRYECICDCGKSVIKTPVQLRVGLRISCGCKSGEIPSNVAAISIGDTFGKLTVISSVFINEKKKKMHTCKCECGNTKDIEAFSLRTGNTKSCGRCTALHPGMKFGKLTVIKRSDKKTPDGRAWFDCRCDCGNTHTVWGSILKNGNVKSCGCLRKIEVGTKFNMLTMIRKVEQLYKNVDSMYEYMCDCGNICVKIGKQVSIGNVKSCGCLSKIEDREHAIKRGLYKNIVVNKNKRMGFDSDITFEKFKDIINKPCHYCGVTGGNQKPDYSNGRLLSDTVVSYNGLDRVDSAKGYTQDNVVTCCISCNFAKSDLSVDEFKSWVKRAYEFYALPVEPHRQNVVVAPLNKIKLKNSKGGGYASREMAIVNLLYGEKITRARKETNRESDISLDYFNELIRQPCYYCGVEGSRQAQEPLRKNNTRASNVVVNHNGVDQIDSQGGYTISNTVSCCWTCNRAKSDKTQEEFKVALKRMHNHFVIGKPLI